MSLRVLIVEDEAPIAFLLEDAVEDCGHTVVLTVSNITDAMKAAVHQDFDIALLDLNLHGQKAHAVAVAIAARRKKFAFITGYGADGGLDSFSGVPVLAKPFRVNEVCELIERLAGPPTSAVEDIIQLEQKEQGTERARF